MTVQKTTDERMIWFDRGVSIGLTGASIIAEKLGASDVVKALRSEHDNWFPKSPAAGEAEYQSWMVELEMQSWERSR